MRLDPPILLAIGAGTVPLAQAGFSVYAPYDKDPIAQALGISSKCLAYLFVASLFLSCHVFLCSNRPQEPDY